MAKVWRNGAGKIIRLAGKIVRCPNCPCGCDCCQEDGDYPAEVSVTISGVTGCANAKCADRNGTYVLTGGWNGFACVYSTATGDYSDCPGWMTLNLILSYPVNNCQIELEVVDDYAPVPIYTHAFFYSAPHEPCDGSYTLSDPTVNEPIDPGENCPDCDAWCDWSNATVSVVPL